MKSILQVCLGTLLVTTRCAVLIPKEIQFLQETQDRATREEVRQQLGTPVEMALLSNGTTMWR